MPSSSSCSSGNEGIDFVLVEIGGTVGDIEGLPFFEAIRQLGNELPRGDSRLHPPDAGAVHPERGRTEDQADAAFGEGTALDRHTARHPALPLRPRPCRASERRKIALFCNVREEAVIQALDVASIYDVPLAYHREGSTRRCWPRFGIKDAPPPNLETLAGHSNAIASPEGEVTIAIVGKYTGLKDAYKSLNEALFHGGIANRVKVKLEWIESEVFEREDPAPYLENVHGILVPGGFGERGSEGKILAARFARERKRALLRHLLRHADGGNRGGARLGRHRNRRARPSSARARSRSSA